MFMVKEAQESDYEGIPVRTCSLSLWCTVFCRPADVPHQTSFGRGAALRHLDTNTSLSLVNTRSQHALRRYVDVE